MQESLTSKPFILALHDDAHAVRELRAEEMQRVGGGDARPACIETVIFTPDCTEGVEFDTDCD
jgi:hypothetical protein